MRRWGTGSRIGAGVEVRLRKIVNVKRDGVRGRQAGEGSGGGERWGW